MRRLHIALPVIGMLLSGGAALAATGVGGPGAMTGAAASTSAGSTAGRFANEADATRACGGSNVVWGNTSTKVFHVQGDRYYGHTKRGAFMCKSTATAGGFHQSGRTASKG